MIIKTISVYNVLRCKSKKEILLLDVREGKSTLARSEKCFIHDLRIKIKIGCYLKRWGECTKTPIKNVKLD